MSYGLNVLTNDWIINDGYMDGTSLVLAAGGSASQSIIAPEIAIIPETLLLEIVADRYADRYKPVDTVQLEIAYNDFTTDSILVPLNRSVKISPNADIKETFTITVVVSEPTIITAIALKVPQVAGAGLQEDTPYFGASISRNYGLKISKSDGSSEVLLNSDEMSFKAKDANGEMVNRIYFDPLEGNYKFTGNLHITQSNGSAEILFNGNETTFKALDAQGVMRDRIYFDTLTGKYVFDGDLAATTIEAVKAQIDVVVSETVIVNNLYAQNGRIANLTVNHLLTGDFLSGDSELFYIDIFADNLNFIQAYKTDEPKVQYTDYNGSLLYWESEAHEFMTTDITEWPVMVDVYDSAVVYSVKVEDITDASGTLRVPTITFGRGDGATPLSAKGRLYKNRDSLVVEYNASNTGDKRELILFDQGIIMMVNNEEVPAGLGVTSFGSIVLNPGFIPGGIIRNIHYFETLPESMFGISEGDIVLVPRVEEGGGM